MDAFLNFCLSMLRLFIAAIQTLFEVVQYFWSNSELRQWICDSIAESPWPVYLVALVILSLGGGVVLTKGERRQV